VCEGNGKKKKSSGRTPPKGGRQATYIDNDLRMPTCPWETAAGRRELSLSRGVGRDFLFEKDPLSGIRKARVERVHPTGLGVAPSKIKRGKETLPKEV